MPKQVTSLDVAGNAIAAGDIVSFVKPGNSRLDLGQIVNVSPKGARIKSFATGRALSRNSTQITYVTDECRDQPWSLLCELYKAPKR
jgi:hypothetical protein